jgi:hypothetical protein
VVSDARITAKVVVAAQAMLQASRQPPAGYSGSGTYSRGYNGSSTRGGAGAAPNGSSRRGNYAGRDEDPGLFSGLDTIYNASLTDAEGLAAVAMSHAKRGRPSGGRGGRGGSGGGGGAGSGTEDNEGGDGYFEGDDPYEADDFTDLPESMVIHRYSPDEEVQRGGDGARSAAGGAFRRGARPGRPGAQGSGDFSDYFDEEDMAAADAAAMSLANAASLVDASGQRPARGANANGIPPAGGAGRVNGTGRNPRDRDSTDSVARPADHLQVGEEGDDEPAMDGAGDERLRRGGGQRSGDGVRTRPRSDSISDAAQMLIGVNSQGNTPRPQLHGRGGFSDVDDRPRIRTGSRDMRDGSGSPTEDAGANDGAEGGAQAGAAGEAGGLGEDVDNGGEGGGMTVEFVSVPSSSSSLAGRKRPRADSVVLSGADGPVTVEVANGEGDEADAGEDEDDEGGEDGEGDLDFICDADGAVDDDTAAARALAVGMSRNRYQRVENMVSSDGGTVGTAAAHSIITSIAVSEAIAASRRRQAQGRGGRYADPGEPIVSNAPTLAPPIRRHGGRGSQPSMAPTGPGGQPSQQSASGQGQASGQNQGQGQGQRAAKGAAATQPTHGAGGNGVSYFPYGNHGTNAFGQLPMPFYAGLAARAALIQQQQQQQSGQAGAAGAMGAAYPNGFNPFSNPGVFAASASASQGSAGAAQSHLANGSSGSVGGPTLSLNGIMGVGMGLNAYSALATPRPQASGAPMPGGFSVKPLNGNGNAGGGIASLATGVLPAISMAAGSSGSMAPFSDDLFSALSKLPETNPAAYAHIMSVLSQASQVAANGGSSSGAGASIAPTTSSTTASSASGNGAVGRDKAASPSDPANVDSTGDAADGAMKGSSNVTGAASTVPTVADASMVRPPFITPEMAAALGGAGGPGVEMMMHMLRQQQQQQQQQHVGGGPGGQQVFYRSVSGGSMNMMVHGSDQGMPSTRVPLPTPMPSVSAAQVATDSNSSSLASVSGSSSVLDLKIRAPKPGDITIPPVAGAASAFSLKPLLQQAGADTASNTAVGTNEVVTEVPSSNGNALDAAGPPSSVLSPLATPMPTTSPALGAIPAAGSGQFTVVARAVPSASTDIPRSLRSTSGDHGKSFFKLPVSSNVTTAHDPSPQPQEPSIQ